MIVLVLFSSQLKAQEVSNISGIVTDAESKEPIAGVNVYLDSYTGTVTDSAGRYSLDLKEKGKIAINFSFIGYEKTTVAVNTGEKPKTVLNVKLYSSTREINPVVITASRHEQSSNEVVVSLQVVKPYLLENKNTTNFNTVLDQIPGVNVTDGQANIRGGSGWSFGAGTRVLVLVDDMPLLSGDAGQALWTFVPLENIQSVEVIKGASSVLYGSSALNGIINVRTLSPKKEPVTRFSAFSGFYDKPKSESLHWYKGNIQRNSGATLFHSRKIKNLDLTASLFLLSDEGYRLGENDNRGRFSFNTRYRSQKVKGLDYGLNGNVMLSSNGTFLLWDSLTTGYVPLDSNVTKTKSYRFNTDPFVSYTVKNAKHHLKGRFLRVYNDNTTADPNVNQDNSSNLYYSEYQYQRNFPSSGIVFTSGLVGSLSVSNSPLFQGTHRTSNLAAFGQGDKKWKKLNVSLGGRLERYSLDDYNEVKPVFRGGMNYEIGRYTFLRASAGQGYRFPTVAESYIETSLGLLGIFPNPELRSESGWSAETGLRQGLKLRNFIAFADVAFFWMEYDNMMEFTFAQWVQPSPTNPLGIGFKSVNVGKTRINGVDFSLNGQGRIGKVKLITLAGYTFMNPKSLEPDRVYAHNTFGQPITYRNSSSNDERNILKYRYRHLVKADLQADYGRFSAGASFRYNSFMENVDTIFVQQLFEFFIPGIRKAREMGVNGDYIVDTRVSYEIRSNLNVNFIVNNLFNRLYMTRPTDLRPPRNFMVQLNYKIQ